MTTELPFGWLGLRVAGDGEWLTQSVVEGGDAR
jgi:hypothetical protein